MKNIIMEVYRVKIFKFLIINCIVVFIRKISRYFMKGVNEVMIININVRDIRVNYFIWIICKNNIN